MLDAPAIEAVYDRLSHEYPTFDEGDDPWITNGLSATPYRVIVSTALSTVTHSKRVIRACNALFERADDFTALASLEDDDLRELIRPVAHYNNKTRTIKAMAQQILDRHDGQIPDTDAELLALPGIGRKCADIVMTTLFETPSVAVDTHVHRLANRLGMAHTRTHDATADRLNDITPDRYRRHAHEWLIQHGGQICVARRPLCDDCVLADLCEYRVDHPSDHSKHDA
ncbi:endonuclease III [Rathayibacter festucae]|uniref:endonuclease III domain-containing protein n=1 Tax=Rathayibacter festucae TaxID=110937 RepID=UPI002A6AC8B4|nr:endonuclease III [Rathayibacter festucae]MDY0912252.1 endonuclease III [Rathayibacter festucae]